MGEAVAGAVVVCAGAAVSGADSRVEGSAGSWAPAGAVTSPEAGTSSYPDSGETASGWVLAGGLVVVWVFGWVKVRMRVDGSVVAALPVGVAGEGGGASGDVGALPVGALAMGVGVLRNLSHIATMR